MTTSMIPETQAAAARRVQELANGFVPASAMSVVVRLRVADLLATGPKTAEQLAAETKTHGDSLARVLRLLSSLGVFEELPGNKFSNNAASESIRSGVPNSQLELIEFLTDPFHFSAYSDMLPTVKDGRTAVEHVYGKGVFEVFAEDPDEQRRFDNAMTNISQNAVPCVLQAYDFSGIETLVDVAGGHGALLTAILEKHPAMKGILFDLPHVVPGAKQRIQAMGLTARCGTEGGDFFKSVPAGDAYIMKHIIHDWDDERAVSILKNCRKAITSPKGKVLLVELILSGPNQPDPSKIMDVEMMMLPGGRERTEEQYAELFAKSGFKLGRVVRTSSPFCVIEATCA